MHGRKWSELGFEVGLNEDDKQLTVKKANKRPTDNQNSFTSVSNNSGTTSTLPFSNGFVALSGLPVVQASHVQVLTRKI